MAISKVVPLIIVLSLFSVSMSKKQFLTNENEVLTENDLFKLFQNFMTTYEVSYTSMNELLKRFTIFKDNLKAYDYQFNQFADLTQEEFSNQYLNLKVLSDEEIENFPKLKVNMNEDVPESFDWREHNGVTPVKNQGQCGSCWAFSATANIESINAVKTGKLVSLSEQQIVDCDTIDHGCGGGWQEKALDYIIQTGGLEADSEYIYTHKKGDCKFNKEKVAVKISNYEFVSKDEEEIKAALVQNGPLAAALNAQMLQYYHGGVFHVKWPFTCDPKLLNHAVLIVGYGQTNLGEKYWIVKNSWGSRWGEKGFFRMLRGTGECGINTHVLTAKLN